MFTKSHCEEIKGYRLKLLFDLAVYEKPSWGTMRTLSFQFLLTLSSRPELRHRLSQQTAGRLLAQLRSTVHRELSITLFLNWQSVTTAGAVSLLFPSPENSK